MMFNLNDSLPIVVERPEEDVETFIDRTFDAVKDKERMGKCAGALPQDLKVYIESLVTQYTKSKTKRENFYEHELIKSYKERISCLQNQISFLEDEVRHKNDIINTLLKQCPKNNNSVEKKSYQSDINESIPNIINIDTPETSFIEDKSPEIENSNKSVIKNQLNEIRQKKHQDFVKSKKVEFQLVSDTCTSNKSDVLVIGDSMMNAVKDKGVLKNYNNIKIKYFSGAKIDDVKPQIKTLVENKPKLIIIHLGTNDAPLKSSNEILDNLLSFKHNVEKLCPESKVIISSLTPRLDHGKANITINHFNNHLKQLKIDIMDNKNITTQDLGRKGLHLSAKGKQKMARNILETMKKYDSN